MKYMIAEEQKINNSEIENNGAEANKIEKTPIKERNLRQDEIDRELRGCSSDGTENLEKIEIQRNQEFENKMQEMGMAGIPMSDDTKKLIYQNMVDDSIDHAKKENERFNELQKERKVVKYLNENLPENEDRISEFMDKNCEVSIVIPAYGEREDIFRPIESLTKQKGVSVDAFETIFVINNPGSVPKRENVKGTDEDYKRKVEHYQKALSENKECLKIIDYINGKNVDVELNQKEKEIIEKVKSLGIKIFSIDKATEGKTLSEKDANVGGARNRGVAEAVARFYEQKKINGIIAQSDADTILDENYVQNLIKVFHDRPELVGIVGDMEFDRTEDSELFRKVSLYSEMQHNYKRVLDYFVNDKMNKEDKLATRGVFFSGANMASRAYEAAMVGGVPKIGGGEDPEFGYALAKIGEVDRIPEIKVITADRFSPRTDVGAGHGQERLRIMESVIENGGITVDSPEHELFMAKIGNDFKDTLENKTTSVDNLKNIFNIDGKQLLDDEDFELLNEKLTNIDNIESIDFKNDEGMKKLSKKITSKVNELFPSMELEDASGKLIEMIVEDNDIIKEKYEAIKQEMIKRDNEEIIKKRKMLNSVLEIVFDQKNGDLEKDDFVNILKDNSEKIGLDAKGIDKLEGDANLMGKFLTGINDAETKEDAYENITNSLKDEFMSVGENKSKLKVFELRAMRQAKEELAKGERV